MTWLGWLTKGHMNVSILDRLVFVAELLAAFAAYLACAYVWFLFSSWRKSRKERK